MSKLVEQAEENKSLEAGMFYPKGFIVAGFPAEADTRAAEKALLDSGFAPQDVTFVSANDMQAQASANLENPSIFVSIGSTLNVRQKQYELARDGCSFLLIKAVDEDEEQQAITALTAQKLRYAVKYRLLVIENLMPLIETRDAHPEPARVP